MYSFLKYIRKKKKNMYMPYTYEFNFIDLLLNKFPFNHLKERIV